MGRASAEQLSLRLQVERVVTIMQNPRQYKIPDWFLNRQKDVKDGKYSQVGDCEAVRVIGPQLQIGGLPY